MKKYINPELEIKELGLETAITASEIDFDGTGQGNGWEGAED